MKTIIEYLQSGHLINDKYKNKYWSDWAWGNKKIPDSEYDEVYQFVEEKYGDLSVESFIQLAKDYYLDYLEVSYPDRKHNNEEAKDTIQHIENNKDDYTNDYHPSFGQGFIDFVYKNCVV